ncbi:hypothetical protein ACXU4B_08030 [Dyella soli]|uniref:Uncharacterized protein n=1 Tax=Dyella soli TaxID=522319 RepID=A0A4V2NLY5_9GAMM|nr:hypothetical protein [Dyella soli]TCI10911.1 hypothetical protein EZM97_18925 [Dyella soli]
MKRIATLSVLAGLVLAAFVLPTATLARGSHSSGHTSSPVHVSGHTTKTGTYVPAHYRTAPDQTKLNNWSTKGNVNPYTGKEGTKNPYGH